MLSIVLKNIDSLIVNSEVAQIVLCDFQENKNKKSYYYLLFRLLIEEYCQVSNNSLFITYFCMSK